MYAAKIELGWANKWFKGETAIEIMRKVEDYQDFGCLIRMSRMYEDKNGQKEIDKLETFINKYYDDELTIEDIKSLDIHLSIGNFKCHRIAIGEEEVQKISDAI